ncbi:EAL domain-containing protein [Neobacillus terrae]|uniref:EAL domain-containing protein n=1 Tax=Neobacillus terrae TaxID=3034837 RepID=UPI00140CA080|nr:EAL domain-containing protein [Neobacillus terrae]NHM33005.1 EAL domain-containing protein [Neobacillus terrae]
MSNDAQNFSILVREQSFFHEYQPLWNTKSKKVFAYEALLRTEPRINPVLIFKQGREKGVLYDFDTASISKSIKKYPDSYWDNFFLFVNIFPSTIIHPKFTEFIEGLVNEYPIIKGRVIFEINEDPIESKLWNEENFINGLLFLKSMKLLIALDDLSFTSNAFEKIIQIKPHFAKLDRTCSENLAKSLEKQTDIESFLAITDNHSVVVLEGIEKKEDYVTACNLGILAVQGYYISKPQRL